MVSVYNFDDYRKYIEAVVKDLKNPWGIWSQIAKAAGCQSTYLTQAMKGRAELTADHAIGIADFFELTHEETQFFILILDYERAATKKLKDFLYDKIRKTRKDQEDLAKRINSPRLDVGEKEALYYSSWYWSAIHVLVSVPAFRTTHKISERLCLPLEQTRFALAQLKNFGLVKQERDHWVLGTGDIHIPKNSPLIGMHHQNWRTRAIQDSTNPLSDGLHFTGVHSMSASDAAKIKTLFLDLIDKNKKIIAPSPEEDVFCINIDFFNV